MFQIAEESFQSSDEVIMKWFPVDSIRPDVNQPRTNKPVEHFESLALSISSEGLHNMIHVCETEEGATIVNGECRWTACAMFLRKYVPGDFVMGHVRSVNGVIEMFCEVKTFRSDKKRRVNQILDNASRKNFDPLEELRAIHDLRESGMDLTEIAGALGRSEKVVEADLPILAMPDDLLKVYDTGEMTKIVAREICKFASHKQMKTAWKKAARAKGTKAQLAHIEAYRKDVDKETSEKALGDAQENTPEKRAAKSLYRKLMACLTKATDENLINENKHLMVAVNSRNLAEVSDLAKNLAKIAKNLADGVILIEAEKAKHKKK